MTLHCVMRGIVQGVNFRAATRREAHRLGLGGWVANRPDGSVEIVAHGDQAALEQLLSWAHRGPPAAHVDDVEAELRSTNEAHSEFIIRFSDEKFT